MGEEGVGSCGGFSPVWLVKASERKYTKVYLCNTDKFRQTATLISVTHLKTTSCSMLSSILVEADLKPTVIIGGIVNNFGSNTLSGATDVVKYFVLEWGDEDE